MIKCPSEGGAPRASTEGACVPVRNESKYRFINTKLNIRFDCVQTIPSEPLQQATRFRPTSRSTKYDFTNTHA